MAEIPYRCAPDPPPHTPTRAAIPRAPQEVGPALNAASAAWN
ncbi:hypothetical protein E2C01_074735 [Portunus trituberculatus]|uniref:Uncharacterized protein n=1 Tax=Portunus trituberculatus TaxID=210409 RepID=A0A5B7IDY1_PORTR|nr:hypothetical protein [Portunus trituberculatus]